MSTVVDRLTAVRARLGKLPERLGVPQYRKVVIELPNGSQVVPEAKLKVVDVDRATIGGYLSEQVQVSGSEYVISGIPRYTSDYTQGFTEAVLNTCTYLIDATLNTGTGRWTGAETARAVWVKTSETLTYTVVVLPRRLR